MIVLDNSAAVDLLLEDSTRSRAIAARLRGDRVYAPELIDVEAAATVRRLVLAGVLEAEVAEGMLSALASLPIERMAHGPLIPRIWALRDNLTPYDAAYVALAESLDASLVTLDARLARSPGIRCVVELIS